MVAPLVVAGGVVVGGALLGPSDSGSVDEIMKDVGFNHPEKYSQIHEGAGTADMHRVIDAWERSIASDFDKVATLLDEANAKAGIAWQGQAAEQHGGSLKPMTNFIRDAKEVSVGVGKLAGDHTTAFGNVRNGMPEPVKVNATDSLLEKGGAWLVGGETDLQRQEREATEKAQEAKRVYQTYDKTVGGAQPPQYQAPPQMAQDQGAGNPQQNGSVNSPMGVGGGGSSQPVGGSGSGSGDGGGGAGLPGGGSNVPASTTSSWATPPSGPGHLGGLPGNVPGGTGTGGGAGGLGGGLLPGAIGAGAAAGGGLGAGGRAGGGVGAGAGAGGRAAGGRGGAGTLGAGARGAGARGAAGAVGGAAGARGRGQEGEDDFEHENKYMLPTDDAWDELGLPKVAPPVLGDWGNDGSN